MKVTKTEIRRRLKAIIKAMGRDEAADLIGVNPEYLVQQANGSREPGMRVLRYLKIRQIKTTTYEVMQ
jgi:DNA-binding transcriptional regulator YdaS (Cro superfamily)